MGEKDSSKTRVKPVFDALFLKDKTGLSWLGKLLKLPSMLNMELPLFPETLPLNVHAWGDNEKALFPPRSLLRWLIMNLEIPENYKIENRSENTQKKREALIRKDPAVIREALSLLEHPVLLDRAWYILEVPTYPDVYLETEILVVVIEGKRTEYTSTTKTTWMPVRHQILRHLDCAWEIRGSRKLFGFFIVEGEGGADAVNVPERWMKICSDTISRGALAQSLPHRTLDEQAEIAKCFLGALTWQKICAEFQIDWSILPSKIG